jgi:uncharacterized glyoxalase superfamily protein PhnB
MKATDITDKHVLHGVQAVLFVADVRKTLDYYRDTLGFHIDFEAGEPLLHARVSSGDRDHASAARIRFETAPSSKAMAPSCYLYVHVGSNIDELFQVYRNKGIEIVMEPKNQPWGLREFEIRDCNGYVLTFAQEWNTSGAG